MLQGLGMTQTMVVGDGRWTPIAPTPTGDGADVNSIAFIKAFFEDFPYHFPGSIATRAADYTKIFENKGFDSKGSSLQTKWKSGKFLKATRL